MNGDAGQSNLEARYPLDAGSHRVKMHAVSAPQQRSVNIEQVCVLRIPGEPRLNGDARFVARLGCLHALGWIGQPWRKPWRAAPKTGRSARGGRLRPARISARLSPNSAMVRLSVL